MFVGRAGSAGRRGRAAARCTPTSTRQRLIEVIGGATLLRLLLLARRGTRRRLGRPDDCHRRPRCDGLTAWSDQPFPTDWHTALVLVPHPDDTEYGCAAAVAKWTSQGKTRALRAGVPRRGRYSRGCRRRNAARCVSASSGGHRPSWASRMCEFWDFPDSQIFNTPELRAKIAETITELSPDVVITLYSGPQWAPGAPNQRDHIEFSFAVAAAYDSLPTRPRWFFEYGPRRHPRRDRRRLHRRRGGVARRA